MADNRTITPNFNFVELDFNNIRESLKEFLSQQDTLQDFDFEGSTMSVLLDVLAYNTQYNGFYHAMASSEAYLESATRRNNVVSRAKALSYLPRSARASSAIITLTFSTDSATYPTYIIPEGTSFSGGDASFFTLEDKAATIVSDNGTTKQWSVQLSIFAGKKVQNTKTVTDSDLNGVVIPNKNVDTTTLTVTVKDSPSSTVEVPFVLVDEIDILTPLANAYFIEETDGEKYRVYFGNDVIGKSVGPPNVVKMSYLVAESDANGVNTFQLSSGLVGSSSLSITVDTPSAGGRAQETVSEIKLKAPRFYVTQNRAVTARDYRSIIENRFSNIKSVVTWGGEDNDPVAYGYAFAAIQPITGGTLTLAEKAIIVAELKSKYSVVTIQPIVVDPDFTYLNLTSRVKYNPQLTSNPEKVKSSTISTITDYSDNNLNKFSSAFRHSTLVTLIDNSDISVNSNVTDVVMEKRILNAVELAADRSIKFNNRIIPGTLKSNCFNFLRINVTARGSGYTEVPVVTLSGGDGADGTAIAVLGEGAVGSVTQSVLSSSDHTTATVTFGAPPVGGTQAEGTAIIVGGEIVSINITEQGSGYITAPSLTVSGDGTTDPTFTAVVQNPADEVAYIKVTNQGDYVSTPPTVSITLGGGSGATADAEIITDAYITDVDCDLYAYSWDQFTITVTRKGHGLVVGDRIKVFGATHPAIDTIGTNFSDGYVVGSVISPDQFTVYTNAFTSTELKGSYGVGGSDNSLLELKRSVLEGGSVVGELVESYFGDISLATGNFVLDTFGILSHCDPENYVFFRVTPFYEEVVPVREQLLVINQEQISVTLEIDISS